MTDIVLIKGKLIEWTQGDTFVIKSEDGDRFNFWFPPEVSPERTELLDAMFNRNDVEVAVRVIK